MDIRFLGLSGWLRPWINFIWNEINSFQNFECVPCGPRSGVKRVMAIIESHIFKDLESTLGWN